MYPSRKFNASQDYNGLTIGGHAVLSFTERIAKHYEARGSQGLTVQDGNGYVYVIGKAVAAAEACKVKLALDRVNTIIGHGTPDKADNHDARALFSCAYPGHLGFGERFLGDNGFAIDGGAEFSVTEVGAERYETYGWQGHRVQFGNLT